MNTAPALLAAQERVVDAHRLPSGVLASLNEVRCAAALQLPEQAAPAPALRRPRLLAPRLLQRRRPQGLPRALLDPCLIAAGHPTGIAGPRGRAPWPPRPRAAASRLACPHALARLRQSGVDWVVCGGCGCSALLRPRTLDCRLPGLATAGGRLRGLKAACTRALSTPIRQSQLTSGCRRAGCGYGNGTVRLRARASAVATTRAPSHAPPAHASTQASARRLCERRGQQLRK